MEVKMEIKSKALITVITLICLLIVSVTGYFGYKYIQIFLGDKSWIADFGYKENEIHDITFDFVGDRSCPEIPVKVGNNEYKLGFDTGCGTGIFFTDVIEDKIDFTFLSRAEELKRDGTHRGWNKRVKVSEINVFGDKYKNIETSISDWSMFSSQKFNGTIGLAYFKSKVITLDYAGRRIAVGSNPIDYTKLNSEKYVVLPLHKTTKTGQQDLPFFEAQYNNKPVIVYLDTGKNHSYVYNPDCKNSMGEKPTKFLKVPLKIGSMELNLNDISEVNDIAQADGLPYPTMLELNSDQIWKCNLLVTIDLIEQKIIFSHSDAV
jgi:hypothetical protein